MIGNINLTPKKPGICFEEDYDSSGFSTRELEEVQLTSPGYNKPNHDTPTIEESNFAEVKDNRIKQIAAAAGLGFIAGAATVYSIVRTN
jgi:hypothetical protein